MFFPSGFVSLPPPFTLFSIGLDSYWSSPVQSDPAANWLPPNGNCITLPVAVFSLFCAWLSAKHSLSNPTVLWYRYEGRWRTISKVGDPLNTHADLNHYLRHSYLGRCNPCHCFGNVYCWISQVGLFVVFILRYRRETVFFCYTDFFVFCRVSIVPSSPRYFDKPIVRFVMI